MAFAVHNIKLITTSMPKTLFRTLIWFLLLFLSGGKLLLHGFSSGSVLGPERDPPRHQLPPGSHPAHHHLQQALQCVPPHRPCGQSPVTAPALTDALSHSVL